MGIYDFAFFFYKEKQRVKAYKSPADSVLPKSLSSPWHFPSSPSSRRNRTAPSARFAAAALRLRILECLGKTVTIHSNVVFLFVLARFWFQMLASAARQRRLDYFNVQGFAKAKWAFCDVAKSDAQSAKSINSMLLKQIEEHAGNAASLRGWRPTAT